MYTNVNLSAPIGVMLLLGTGCLLLLLAAVAGYALIRRKSSLTKLSLSALLVVLAAYFGLMLIFSLASSDRVLARGQEKHFCEIDCHLAYSIAEARQTKTLGDGPSSMTASGVFQLITVKTRFDEQTISSGRGNSSLEPNPRSVYLIDESGRKYFPLSNQPSSLAGTPITTPLRPGESYTTGFLFDLPAAAKNPVLVIRESDPITNFVIGHENSLLHKLTKFQI